MIKMLPHYILPSFFSMCQYCKKGIKFLRKKKLILFSLGNNKGLSLIHNEKWFKKGLDYILKKEITASSQVSLYPIFQ